jgi:hypothetical protein
MEPPAPFRKGMRVKVTDKWLVQTPRSNYGEGIVVGGSHATDCAMVKFDRRKYPMVIHKDFIEEVK